MVPPNWQRERESEIHVPLETPQAECGKFGNSCCLWTKIVDDCDMRVQETSRREVFSPTPDIGRQHQTTNVPIPLPMAPITIKLGISVSLTNRLTWCQRQRKVPHNPGTPKTPNVKDRASQMLHSCAMIAIWADSNSRHFFPGTLCTHFDRGILLDRT